MNRAYWVFYRNEETEWGCVVVAQTARQARRVFHRDNPISGYYDEGNNYLNIRAIWRRGIVIPAEITPPHWWKSNGIHANSKVGREQVLDIRKEYKAGSVSIAGIGLKYGMSKRNMLKLLKGQTWKSVKGYES